MARHALIVVALAVVCSSCVPKGPFRSSNCSNPVELARHGLTCSALHEQLRTGEFDRLDVGLNPKNDLLFWPYRLTFIEFRDNGTLFDPGQVDRAVEEIRAA